MDSDGYPLKGNQAAMSPAREEEDSVFVLRGSKGGRCYVVAKGWCVLRSSKGGY